MWKNQIFRIYKCLTIQHARNYKKHYSIGLYSAITLATEVVIKGLVLHKNHIVHISTILACMVEVSWPWSLARSLSCRSQVSCVAAVCSSSVITCFSASAERISAVVATSAGLPQHSCTSRLLAAVVVLASAAAILATTATSGEGPAKSER